MAVKLIIRYGLFMLVATASIGLVSCQQKVEKTPDGSFPKDWDSPHLMVEPFGIRIGSTSLNPSGKRVSAEYLKDALLALPATDWPNGKVVILGRCPIGGGEDKLNHYKTLRILTDLQIKIEPWTWPTS